MANIIRGRSGHFFNDDRLNRYAPGCSFRMVVGAKGCGKTVWSLIRAKKQYDAGKEIAFCRLYKNVFENPSFTQSFLNEGWELGIIPEEWVCDRTGVWDSEDKEHIVVRFFGVNSKSNNKGPGYPNVAEIIVDEFAGMPGERYPSDYPSALHTLIETIARGRDIPVTMFANWMSISNPIWAQMEIYPSHKYDVTAFPDKGTAIEICRNGYYNVAQQSEGTALNKAFRALGRTSQERSEDYDLYAMVTPKLPDGARLTGWSFRTKAGHFHAYSKDTTMIIVPGKHPKLGDFGYINDVSLLNGVDQMIPRDRLKELRTRMETGFVRFTSEKALYAMMQFVYNNKPI